MDLVRGSTNALTTVRAFLVRPKHVVDCKAAHRYEQLIHLAHAHRHRDEVHRD